MVERSYIYIYVYTPVHGERDVQARNAYTDAVYMCAYTDTASISQATNIGMAKAITYIAILRVDKSVRRTRKEPMPEILLW